MPVYTKDAPFLATLRENRKLNREGSAKDTRHFVVDLTGSGLTYTCGDSIGILPENSPHSVEALITAGGFDPEELVTVPKVEEPVSLREALTRYLAIAAPSKKALQTFLDTTSSESEKEFLTDLLAKENAETTKLYLENREYLDLFIEFPGVRLSGVQLVALLRRLVPRLYSIASSPMLYPDEVHLTVAVVRYETNGKSREGVASTWLSDRVTLDDPRVPVFISNSHFGIPADPQTDLIMVGPGTGVAPFRSFIQEQKARQGTGRCWLFFGDQHQVSDFLYEEEFAAALSDGSLHRLDTAFSRDQEQKVYVQDRMRENGRELWEWLEKGASFFVCGDASRMARDVDTALHQIVAEHGNLTPEEAGAYVKKLRSDKRYQKDVY
ncbi:MAG: sulfite reductase flavoprotein subunit alpha [Puniceicoccaceae bacterium]